MAAECDQLQSRNLLAAVAWQLASADPDYVQPDVPASLHGLVWRVAEVPGTVAACLKPEDPPLDSVDWIYRCCFAVSAPAAVTQLQLEGVAGLAEVWLNGQLLLRCDNMFRQYCSDVTGVLQADNQLLLVLRAVDAVLAQKRPRPRWKTRLVDHQNLRFVRRTLLGRIPGWTPPLPALGPYRALALVQPAAIELEQLLTTTACTGQQGVVSIWAQVRAPEGGRLYCRVNGEVRPLPTQWREGVLSVATEIEVATPALWWPHTHGAQGENQLQLYCTGDHGEQLLAERCLRFRQVAFVGNAEQSSFTVNGREIFVRGACWSVADITTLQNDPLRLERLLQQLRQAGMNMLRIGGTMLYETDALYRRCDELGIMVWQDFMFANMDYPFDDPDFQQNCEAEAQQQLQRLARFGCVVAYCGGSEIEQQAAMTGVEQSQQLHPFLKQQLAELCQTWHPGCVYFPSTPTGGAMPFYTSHGVTHYYGVGAYLRDFSDLFVADVKFASECLAFANVPAPAHRKRHFGSLFPAPILPAWKAGVCRDNGSGWDFEDVRDHYLQVLFGVEPLALRYRDLERYYALSEVVSGEVMSQVFQFWRSSLSRAGGGLLWYLQDLVAGAGWGVIDADGEAKPALQIVAQVLQPLQLLLVNKGLEGFWLELVNETGQPVKAELCLDLWRDNMQASVSVCHPIELPAGQGCHWWLEALLGHFLDSSYAYRFGPPQHEVISARLVDAEGALLTQATAYSGSHSLAPLSQVEVQAQVLNTPRGWQLELYSSHYLQRAAIQLQGFRLHQNYCNLVPGQRYCLPLEKEADATRMRGSLTALNCARVFSISMPAEAAR